MKILDLHGSKEFSSTHVRRDLPRAGRRGLFNDGAEQRTLKPGDTVIFPAGEVHQVSALIRMVLHRVHAGPDTRAEMAPGWQAR